MPIHIGHIIEKRAKNRGLSLDEVGKLISRTRQTVADIYKRQSIDTELLLLISKGLEFDFFEVYYNEEPLKSMRDKELNPYKKEIEELKMLLAFKEQRIKDLERAAESDKKIIDYLEKERNKQEK